MLTSIHWPAIIKYTGDHELFFVASQVDWKEDADLHFCYEADDCLIDSKGHVFHLNNREAGTVIPEKKRETIVTIETLNTLIQQHLSQLGHCCVSKAWFETTQEAIQSLADLPD